MFKVIKPLITNRNNLSSSVVSIHHYQLYILIITSHNNSPAIIILYLQKMSNLIPQIHLPSENNHRHQPQPSIIKSDILSPQLSFIFRCSHSSPIILRSVHSSSSVISSHDAARVISLNGRSKTSQPRGQADLRQAHGLCRRGNDQRLMVSQTAVSSLTAREGGGLPNIRKKLSCGKDHRESSSTDTQKE